MTLPPHDPYERTPYGHRAYAETHPDRLRVVARLSGWDPPPLRGASVLEVGSGRGGNLLAMAMTVPGRLHGIDRAPGHVDETRAAVEHLGVTNMTVEAGDFREAHLPEGAFDFVIAHGLASWIEPGARRALFQRTAAWLSPRGVAYVSANVLPGWYARMAARDWLRFVDQPGKGAFDRGGAEALAWLERNASPETGAYKLGLRQVIDRLAETDEPYLRHEWLAGEHHPEPTARLLAEADAAGLIYLGDAIPGSVALEMTSAEVQHRARRLSVADVQTLVDFVRGTAFRRLLFVRKDSAEARSWRWRPALDPVPVASLFVTTRLREGRGGDLVTPAGDAVPVASPFVEAALRALVEAAPRAMAIHDLASGAAQRVSLPPEDPSATLARELLDLWLSLDGVDLVDRADPFCVTPQPLPRACPLARWEASRGLPITNRWHQEVVLAEPILRLVLAEADGTRSPRALADKLGAPEDLVAASLFVLAKSALLADPHAEG